MKIQAFTLISVFFEIISLPLETKSIRVPVHPAPNRPPINSFYPYHGRPAPIQVNQPFKGSPYIWIPFENPSNKFQSSASHIHEDDHEDHITTKPSNSYKHIPEFISKIHENDPFRRNGQHYFSENDDETEYEGENYKTPEESSPISEHEFPLDIPTKPVYPGEGQWARPGKKHKPFTHPNSPVKNPPTNFEEAPSDGHEIFENGQHRFNLLKAKLQPESDHHETASSETKESSNNDVPFIPRKSYAQIRHTEEVRHLPQSEAIKEASTHEELINAPRLREVIKNTQSRVVYTEEGYEDGAYDHAGHEKDAEDHEGFLSHHEALNEHNSRLKKINHDNYKDEGAQRNGSNDEKRSSYDESETQDENYNDRTDDHSGESRNSGKSYRYKKKKPEKKRKIQPAESQRNIQIEKPERAINGWIESTVAKDVQQTVLKKIEAESKVQDEIITKKPFKISTPKPKKEENVKNITKELLKLEESSVKETATSNRRVKRYDREKLSKIYIRKRPVYYWEKNKNKNKTSSKPLPKTTQSEHLTPVPPLLKTIRPIRVRRNLNSEELNIEDSIYNIEDVRKITLRKPPADLTHIKYPYYLRPESPLLNRHSPLRYAENLRNIPPKTEGGLEFYESRSHIICPEIEPDNIDPVPEHVKNGDDGPTPKPPVQRLKGLGDKIDCLKAKYFGVNPLDSPFFKETEIPAPTLDEVFKKRPSKKYRKSVRSSNVEKKVAPQKLSQKFIDQTRNEATMKNLYLVSEYLNRKRMKRSVDDEGYIIFDGQDAETSTSDAAETTTEAIEYLTLPAPTSSTEKSAEVKSTKKIKKKMRIRRVSSTTLPPSTPASRRPTTRPTTTSTAAPSITTSLPPYLTTPLNIREMEKLRAIEINELLGHLVLEENSEKPTPFLPPTTSINPILLPTTLPPKKIFKRRPKILPNQILERSISIPTTPRILTTSSSTTNDLDKDLVFVVDTQGENLLDIPLQLPLVGNSTFGETFDINKYFPKLNFSFNQSNQAKRTRTTSQDQMNVFSDVLQHIQTETPDPDLKDKRAIKVPVRKQRMRIIPKLNQQNSDNVNAESAIHPSTIVDSLQPSNHKTTLLKHEDLKTKDIYRPEKGFDLIPEYSNNPDHGTQDTVEEQGDPYDPSYFPKRDSSDIQNPPSPLKYDLIFNHVHNSYTLRPNLGVESPPQAYSHYSYRNVNTKDEETIVHGLQPVHYDSGIKFIIPQNLIPKPHVSQFRAIVQPSKNIQGPVVRFLIKPKITKTIHLPSIGLMQSLADNLAAKHTTRSVEYLNIPGMHPPPMGYNIQGYTPYYPQTFDRIESAGSSIQEAVVDSNGNPAIRPNRKYTEISQTDRQANLYWTKETEDVESQSAATKQSSQIRHIQQTIQPENSRLISSTVIAPDSKLGSVLRDSYGEVLAKPSLQEYSVVVEENRNHSARFMNEPHEPTTHVNASYFEKNANPENATRKKMSFSNFNRRRRPISTTLRPSTTVDPRRGEPRYYTTPVVQEASVRPKYSSRTRKEFNMSSIPVSNSDTPELAIFKAVQQTPDLFDINTYLPRSNNTTNSTSDTTQEIRVPQTRTRYTFSSRFKADETKLPLPLAETLQMPFSSTKSVNLTQIGTEIQPRVIHLPRQGRIEDKTTTPTPGTSYKTRRRRPIVRSSVFNMTNENPPANRQQIKRPNIHDRETTTNRTRVRPSNIHGTRYRLSVDPVALLHKAQSSMNRNRKPEEAPVANLTNGDAEITTGRSKVVIITPSPIEDVDGAKDVKANLQEVEIFGNPKIISRGPKHGGNYKAIKDQSIARTQNQNVRMHDHKRGFEKEPDKIWADKDETDNVESDPEEILGFQNSDLVEIIGNYDAIRTGPKHGGNYRHINDQKYANTNHNSGASHSDDDFLNRPDRSFAESKHEEDLLEEFTSPRVFVAATTQKPTILPTTGRNSDTSHFYKDQNLPHRVNELKTVKMLSDYQDFDADYSDHENEEYSTRNAEESQSRPAFWSTAQQNSGVHKSYLYHRS